MAEIVSFGEIMLRLATNGHYRFFQNDQMEATFGGSEANVAVSLANFGMDSGYVTKLPDHAIGDGAVRELRYFNVDTSKIVRGGDRVGIYFLEKGASQRGSVCIYDRDNSSIKEATLSDFDWDGIFDGAKWFHFSGITPALGGNLAEICKQACICAKKHGVKISCDINYREKLWTIEQSRKVMTELCKYIDVCMVNKEHARYVLGVEADKKYETSDGMSFEESKSVAEKLADKYGFEKVAVTLRSSISADDNVFAAMLYDGTEYCLSDKYHLHIVDRVGGGDAFAAGLIYSSLCKKSCRDSVEFAVAAAALKHSVEGDFNRVTVSEVEQLVNGTNSGRIRR